MAADEEFDSWSTSAGMVEDFEATVKDAYFATNARYMNGVPTVLHLVFDKGEIGYGEEDKVTLYSLGDGWVSTDGGKTIHDKDGKVRKFAANSKYGKLINRVVELGLKDELSKRGTGQTTDASVWKGLKFHWQTEEETFTDRVSGQPRAVQSLLPVAFLGAEGQTSSQSQPIPETSAPAASALRDQVVQMARTNTDFQKFVDDAMEVPGVSADDALLEEIVSQRIWKEVHA